METAGAGEEDSSDEETRDNLMEVDPDQDRKYLALFLSVFRIRIHLTRIQSGSRGLIQKFKKKLQLKKKILGQNYNLPIPMPQPSALKREHSALQNIKKIFKSFLHSWIRNPDTDTDPLT
jgi:hypothetical protein